ncbi:MULTISPECIES: chemotaxis protein CheB [unclassified Mesorhizobium]|uniref:chemotaxis protein CheB n=1 Tax=unclassified Mesorhizobium TaxID=325217 RepID=UPI0010937A04|nr:MULTISPECIES: chemotaxis protein CheB [unclassified Mesorhizobium]TGT91258.1 PAS domain S-box protein [Mesorhizobium sp. M8A.F.Ca.ET.161.01.1.1]TGV43462.1 PAS domain S-box protein [Mesorhizobium sp. M8A.F.Ca.ET.142.01.1.1]
MAKKSSKNEGRLGRDTSANRRQAAEDGTVGPPNAAIPVVGIGASAGGIEALGSFFDVMPADSGCAFVVVLHLDPKRESEMARILGTRTRMPVLQVEDGMKLAPDHVYVIAPDTDLKLVEDRLEVSRPSEPRGHRHPVDVLFASIARERRERSVAIVLSGTGSNGTEGLKEIRAEGGMSMVQAPGTAKFDGMPRSAISAGLADHVLAPEKMPEALLAYVHHGYVSAPAEVEAVVPKGEATIEDVLEVVRARDGHDFGSYKRNTLRRRVHRRMGLRNIATLADYLDDLRTNSPEVTMLVADLMISVTAFFRDAEAWKTLGELVIAPLVTERESGGSVRVWVPACATGEEAYSIAMAITEYAEACGKRFDLKVFATDAQEVNLRKARDGIYPAAALADFPPERIRRFFEKLDGSFQVGKELRDMVVFASQNLLRDPPFSRLDIVSCRNFLIYLEPEAQQRIIVMCHFALRPDGHLFLGNAETIGRHDDLFETVSKKWRIYRRIGPTRHDLIDYRPPRGSVATVGAGEPSSTPSETISAPLADIARRALLERYAPASVMIDQKGRVVYFHGTTRDYLEQPSGEPTRDILAMARGGLGLKLRGAIGEALKGNKSVTVQGRLHRRGSSRNVAITVMPLPSQPHTGKFALVTFAPGAPIGESKLPPIREDAGDTSSGGRALEDELVSMRVELRTTIEHLETANEELKASNEEATSMNEELQSTNEELETSKEELQSFNEELNTVNSQLQHKIAEQERTTNDLNNLLAGSETATLFLDDKLAINWFAPATKELFDLVTSDIGRPIAHFARKFSDDRLLSDTETVLKKLTTIEAEVPSDAGRWYLRRMLPYRTRDNRIAGVVITFIDITERRQGESAVRASEQRLKDLIAALPGAVYTTDAKGRLTSYNPAAVELWGRRPELGTDEWCGSWRIYRPDGTPLPHDECPMAIALKENRPLQGAEAVAERPDGVRVPFLAYPTPLRDAAGKVTGAVNMLVDITERKRAEELAERLAAIVASSDDAIISKTLDGTITSWNIAAERLFGYCSDEIVGQSIMILVPPDRQDEEKNILGRVRQGEHIQHYETRRRRKDGTMVWVSLTLSPLGDAQGRPIGASTIARDMTERRRADEHRKIMMGELNHRVKNTMAVIQSIASQTLGHASTLDEARDTFSARLINLAKAHDVLTRESWQSANLADIVADTTKPHGGRQGRFRIEGPDIRLTPNVALAIAMALHELSTNAAKYGALTTENGYVEIVWRIESEGAGRRLVLGWQESDGPPVAKPSRKGFGSRLIERALAAELGGEVSVDYASAGVMCTLIAPLGADENLLGAQRDGTGGKTGTDPGG